MKIDELANGIAAGATGEADVAAISADSRTVRPGTLFAALAGSKSDGARFVADAAANGAVAVLAGEGETIETTLPVLRSADPRRALALMA